MPAPSYLHPLLRRLSLTRRSQPPGPSTPARAATVHGRPTASHVVYDLSAAAASPPLGPQSSAPPDGDISLPGRGARRHRRPDLGYLPAARTGFGSGRIMEMKSV
eukprot:scaffold26663_cov134-Isochrysis_galbana.AAC.2